MWASLIHHGNCFDGGQVFFLEGGGKGGSLLNKSSVVEKKLLLDLHVLE